MIEFLYIYLQRTAFFNSTPRLSFIFFGRCFYPQFKTLQAAYDYLVFHQLYSSNRIRALGQSKNLMSILLLPFKKIIKGESFKMFTGGLFGQQI